MPTYSYECKKCNHEFDTVQRITEEPLKDCPKCSEEQSLQKVIKGTGGFSLKGTGWYVTDFKGNN